MISMQRLNRVAATQRAELYWMAYPGSPSAVQQPRLFMRGKMWIALLGSSLRNGIAGFGPTIESALKEFDAQYLRALRAPEARAIRNCERKADNRRKNGFTTIYR